MAAIDPIARTQDRRAARRVELLDAAVDAIRRLGPGVTMEQLAQAGGITKPILYRHFGDRDGLIDAIAERFSTAMLTSVTTPLAADATARDLLRSTVDSFIGFIEREPNLYRFMIQQTQTRRGDTARVRSLIDRIAGQVADIAFERLERAGRDPRAARPWAYAIVGMIHQAGDWWIDDQTITRDELVNHLVALAWSGLTEAPSDGQGA